MGAKVRHEGLGATFWYLRYNTTIAVVPVNIQDAPFVFQDITSDHQTVTCQGQFSFRFADPAKAVKTLNLTIDPRTGAFQTTDLEMLSQRLSNAVRQAASSEIQSRDLAANIRNFQQMGGLILERARHDPVLHECGVEIINLIVLSVQPIPEVSKALEAEFREGLLRKADEAIYARRAASVDEERKIKEKELASELAIAEGRRTLIEREGENKVQEAAARGRALEAESNFQLDKLRRELELWQSTDPALVAALGFRLLGTHGATNLTITSEVLSALLTARTPPEDGRH